MIMPTEPVARSARSPPARAESSAPAETRMAVSPMLRLSIICSRRVVNPLRGSITFEFPPLEPRLPEAESPPARRQDRAPRRTTPVATESVAPESATSNGDAPATDIDAEASPLLAAVLAAQRSHRLGVIELAVAAARAVEKMGFAPPAGVQARAMDRQLDIAEAM